jgi:hypothetical protein
MTNVLKNIAYKGLIQPVLHSIYTEQNTTNLNKFIVATFGVLAAVSPAM